MEFERLLTLPAFQGSRDLYTYDLQSFQRMIASNVALRSQSELERRAKAAKKRGPAEAAPTTGVDNVATHGNLNLLKITEAEALSWWAWQAYKEENPSWNRPTIHPPPPGTDPFSRDGKWCVRSTTHGFNYLRQEPFYMVLKNGWPYVGILLKQGQAKDLDNKQITMGVAEEIYPILSPFISALKAEGESLVWECKIFENMRFLHGGMEPGETVSGPVNLANTNLSNLPSNLTVRGVLDMTGCKNFTQLPPGLRVEGTLKISGTGVSVIPEDLFVEDMEWSEPLTLPKLKHLFYNMRLPDMGSHYQQYLKDEAEKEAAWNVAAKAAKSKGIAPPVHPRFDPATGKNKKKPRSWPVMKVRLVKHFQVSKEIDKNVKTLYRYIPSSAEPTE